MNLDHEIETVEPRNASAPFSFLLKFISRFSFSKTPSTTSRNPWLRRIGLSLGFLLLLAIGAKAMVSLTGLLRLTPLAVTVVPSSSITPQQQAVESQTVGLAFDRDTTTSYTAFGNSRVKVTFEGAEVIRRLRVFGASPYVVSVSMVDGQGNLTPVQGWTNLDLSSLSSGWNNLNLGNAVTAASLSLSVTPKGGNGTAGISEMEFWGNGIAQNVSSGQGWESIWSNLPPSSPSTLLMSGREYASTDAVQSIGGEGGSQTGSFTVNLPMSGSNYRRAWLMYDVEGLSSWITVPRTINGSSGESAGGWPLAGSSNWSTQAEPIHPAWLVSGANKVTFSVPLGVVSPYQVRNVRIVVEEDNGANLIDQAVASAGDASVLLDGDETTGWRPYVDGGASPSVTLNLYRTTAVDNVQLYVNNPIGGQVVVGVLQNGTWMSLGDAMGGSGLSSGWQQVPVKANGPVDGVSLTFLGGSGSGAVMEAMVEGSGVGKPYGQTVEISYPDSGEYFGQEAYIRGFLGQADNGSGPAQVMLGPKQVNVMNGQFEGVIGQADLGLPAGTQSWAVTVTALYPDGTQIQRVVPLTVDQSASPQGFGTYAQKVLPGNTTVIDRMGARIEMAKDALAKKLDLKVVGLHTLDLPAMNPGMTNVTGGQFRGYRMLPHGTVFKSKVKLTLPYDESLLPAGKTAKDVRTYYFDTNRGTWMPLELSKTDRVNGKIESLTKHFTDFVNATITTPSNPQEVNFNPNQIKDIKAADPGAQVNLIEPPQANNNGTANLSYPIEVPAGRKGVQPQLSVAYNSAGGDGLMGVGWDLPMQTITVETRWGVPRYWDGSGGTTNVESETYLLNGEMLTEDISPSLPSYLSHRYSASADPGVPFYGPRLTGAVTFHTRTESKFDLIIRHDNGSSSGNASNYWWEVTDKNGMKYYYGGSPDGSEPDSSAVLRDGSGHIFLWALREMKDPNHNSMQYAYDIATMPKGSEIYCHSITYTGVDGNPTAPGAAGYYFINFYHGQGNYLLGNSTTPVLQQRPDVPLNAKGGFPRATGDVLDHLDVMHNNGSGSVTVRSYHFIYELGAFSKTLLQSVQQWGPVTMFPGNTHVFSYYNDVQSNPAGSPNSYNGFTQQSSWTGPGDTGDDDGDVVAGSVGFQDGKPTALGQVESSEVGGHFYFGFAPGFGFTKGDSFGFKIGYSQTNGDGKLQFIDIDGDGLPDLVFKQGGGNGPLMYYKNLGVSGPGGTLTFDSTPRHVIGISTISSDNSNMLSGGIEVYIGGINGMFNTSGGTNQQTAFFTDVNGDGIPDLVMGNTVYFGHDVLDSNGVPQSVVFEDNSGNTPDPLCAGGGVQATNFMPDFSNQFSQAATQDPLVDTVKQWTAPYDGVITIVAPATLIANPSMVNPPQDGIRVRVEMAPSQSVFPSSSQNNTLASVLIPVSAQGVAQPINIGVTVHMDDRIYFREQSIFDGKYDVVGWNPQINYEQFGNTSIGFTPATVPPPAPPAPDENNLDATSYNAAKDFTLAGRRGIAVNLTNSGTVTLGGDITLNSGLSDAVSLLVIENQSFNNGNPAQSTTLYAVSIPPSTPSSTFPQTIPLTSGTVLPPSVSGGPNPFATIQVGSTGVTIGGLINNTSTGGNEEDQIQMVFVTDSNIDIKALQWAPTMGYIAYVPPGQTAAVAPTTPITVEAPYDILYYPEGDLTEPQMPFALSLPFANSGPLTWIITPELNLPLGHTLSGNVVLTVKQNGFLVNKQVYNTSLSPIVGAGALAAIGQPLTITTDSTGLLSPTDSFFVNLTFANENDKNSIDTATDVAIISQYTNAANATPQPPVSPGPPQFISDYEVDSPGPSTTVFPAAYRGWSYAAFQANPPGPITNSTNGSSQDLSFPETVFNLPSSSSLPSSYPSQTDLQTNDAAAQNFQSQMQTVQSQTLVVVLHPDPASGNWAGPTTEIYDGPTGMESSRLLADEVQLPVNTSQLGGTPSQGGGANGCGAGAVGAMRISNNSQNTFGVGGGFAGLSANGSIGNGSSTAVLDYMDLNGDGYPDILTQNGTQYTVPVGGMEDGPRSTVALNRVSNNAVTNVGAGGDAAAIVSSGKGKTQGSGSQMAPIGVGFNGSIGGSGSDQKSDLIDMNGDGLPDQVYLDSSRHLWVALNTGYGFAPAQDWTPSNGSATINGSSSGNGGGGVGFNDNVYGFAGGINGSNSDSKTTLQLADINGDGLPDVVISQSNGSYLVYMNTGSGFASTAVTWNGGPVNYINRNVSETGGGGLYVTIPIPIPFVGSIILNPGADATFTANAPHAMLTDVKGDGSPDLILSDNPGDFRVYMNNWGRTNLLKEVDRPLGAKIFLDYNRTQHTYANPHNRWNMVNVVTYDGGQNSNVTGPLPPVVGADFQQMTYDYTSGFYDRYERDFLGYAAVTELQRNTTGKQMLDFFSSGVTITEIPSYYRRLTKQYLNANFYEKGLMFQQNTDDVQAGLGGPVSYLETDNAYVLHDIFAGDVPLNDNSLSVPTNTIFPQAVTTVNQYFEHGTGDMATTQTFSYDAIGNVIGFFDSGDASENNSPVSVSISYTAEDSSFNVSPSYIMGLPESMTAYDVSNAVLRHRTAVYTPQGDEARINEYLADGTSAEYDYAYDSFGMLVSQMNPVNAQGYRYTLAYKWDGTVHTYPVSITDGMGYITSYNYDFRFGQPVTESDENSNQIFTAYDDYGRTVTIIGPFEASTSNNFHNHWTIAFDYHPEAYLTGGVPYAHTQHFDPYRNPNDPIDTILFVDGLDRVIQTKKDDTIFMAKNQAPQDEMGVSGRIVYDQVGRTIAQYYPLTEPTGAVKTTANFTFNTQYDSVPPTTMTYDILDRNLVTVIPDGSGVTIAYDISTDNVVSQFRTTVTDQDSNIKRTYKDVRELIRQVNEYNGPSTVITTTYNYDPVKEITQVTDVNGNQTTVTYDNLGRRLAINNPDTGNTRFFYDLASNMTSKITQNLANEGGNRAIQYRYDADNRMTNILYPDFPQNNVIYTYGAPGASGNTANRITTVVDASGSVQRLYDVMGNVTREVKILTPPTQVNEPFEFVSSSGTTTAVTSGCATCGTSSFSDCATCGFGIWTTGPSLSGDTGWGQRYGLSSGTSCSTCSQGQFIGWGASNDHPLESAALPLTFVTQYTYDTWGRIQAMTYPDGEVLTYQYDSGGLPRSATGMLPDNSQVFPYVLRLEYDKFDQRVFVQNGNGTQSSYSYDTKTRRLSNLSSFTGPTQFQNLVYGYDPVGNVTSLSNQIQPLTPGYLLGGPVTQTFGYDGLYRLTQANGTIHSVFDPSCGSTYDSTYSLKMTYDNINNIVEKNQAATFVQVNNSNNLTIEGPDTRLTYDWQYSYNGPHPHAPTQIGSQEFFYDDNGNNLGYDILPGGSCNCAGANRNMIWDEENRLYAVGDDDPGVRATDYGDVHFVYNDQGTRAYKIQGGNITAYINQFYVVEKPQSCNGFVGSKHIFIGNDRIASQIVNPKDDQTLAIDSSLNPCTNCSTSACATCSGSVSVVQSSNTGWGRSINWSAFSQNIDSQGKLNGTNDQVQYVTALNNGTPIYSSDSVEGTVVGTIDSCETMTLMTLNPYTQFYEVQYNGQPAYVQAASVTVGMPSSCAGVWPNSSVMPNNYFVFFYHPDHLGSTGYMSNGNGVMAEHIEYIPFGESWIDQEQGLGLFPSYQFTSKEWDPETGLYYFGKRYYDPRTSVWQSADPAIWNYLPQSNFESSLQFQRHPNWIYSLNLPGRGGTYNSLNLGLYSYGLNNPVRYTDPDGQLFGVDDLAALGTGALGGIISQAAEDVMNGKFSGVAAYAISAGTGAVGAEVALNVTEVTGNPVLGAAAGGAVGGGLNSVLQDKAKGEQINWKKAAASTAAGALLGGVFKKIPEISPKGVVKGLITKLGKGEIKNLSSSSAARVAGAKAAKFLTSDKVKDKVENVVEGVVGHYIDKAFDHDKSKTETP